MCCDVSFQKFENLFLPLDSPCRTSSPPLRPQRHIIVMLIAKFLPLVVKPKPRPLASNSVDDPEGNGGLELCQDEWGTTSSTHFWHANFMHFLFWTWGKFYSKYWGATFENLLGLVCCCCLSSLPFRVVRCTVGHLCPHCGHLPLPCTAVVINIISVFVRIN